MIADAGNCQVRTRTIYKTLSPFWGEEFHLYGFIPACIPIYFLFHRNIVDNYTRDPSASVKITVWAEDKFVKDNLIGMLQKKGK